jgi:hypothetical protein
MYRSFSPIDLVTVPRTSAASALTLGTSLIAAARDEAELPDVFVVPLEQLEKEHAELRTSRQYRREGRAVDSAAITSSDQRLDSCYSGFHGFLTAWTKLPSTPEGVEKGQVAREVLAVVFPDGLRFLNLPYREQWGESQTKLDRLSEPAVAERVRSLGGEAFVQAIGVAHEAYGVALQVTKPKAEPTTQVTVREPLDNFWDAVRSYVLRVANHLDEHKNDAEAQRLCRALLKPMATWKSSGAGRKGQAAEAPSEGEAGEETGGEEGEPNAE